jgi:hypothetical protein
VKDQQRKDRPSAQLAGEWVLGTAAWGNGLFDATRLGDSISNCVSLVRHY